MLVVVIVAMPVMVVAMIMPVVVVVIVIVCMRVPMVVLVIMAAAALRPVLMRGRFGQETARNLGRKRRDDLFRIEAVHFQTQLQARDRQGLDRAAFDGQREARKAHRPSGAQQAFGRAGHAQHRFGRRFHEPEPAAFVEQHVAGFNRPMPLKGVMQMHAISIEMVRQLRTLGRRQEIGRAHV